MNINNLEKCECGRPAWNIVSLYNNKEDFQKRKAVIRITSCPFCLLEKSTFAIVESQKQGNLNSLDSILSIEVPEELKERVKKSKTIQKFYNILRDNFPKMLGYSNSVKVVKIDAINMNLDCDVYELQKTEFPIISQVYP